MVSSLKIDVLPPVGVKSVFIQYPSVAGHIAVCIARACFWSGVLLA